MSTILLVNGFNRASFSTLQKLLAQMYGTLFGWVELWNLGETEKKERKKIAIFYLIPNFGDLNCRRLLAFQNYSDDFDFFFYSTKFSILFLRRLCVPRSQLLYTRVHVQYAVFYK